MHEVDGARVEMRLEEREHATAVPHGSDVGGELRRMVRVAVEHGDTACFASPLEPAACPLELHDRALCVGAGDACELECRERCGGVPAVVLAGHRERKLDGLEILRTHDVRYVLEPPLEKRLHLDATAEGRMMIEVDVEKNGDLGARCRD